STAGHVGTGDARVVERHAPTIRWSPAPGARQQDRRADHRLRGHRASGSTADVGQASARLPGHGLSHRGKAMTIMNNKLPINLDDLLRQRTVEGERIEYKTGWN